MEDKLLQGLIVNQLQIRKITEYYYIQSKNISNEWTQENCSPKRGVNHSITHPHVDFGGWLTDFFSTRKKKWRILILRTI